MPDPAASLALLEATNRIAGLDLPLGDLASRAEASRARIDELIGQNPEHHAMLEQLEHQADQSASEVQLTDASGDQLVAELERFLREQGSS
jgi:predicted ATP-grasp superfamily ATP-dependent carboligase